MKKKTPGLIQLEREFALVAGMSGDEKTVKHVREALRLAGIRCACEGSVLYDLYVDRSKVTAAMDVLRTEKAKGWKILFPDDITYRTKAWSQPSSANALEGGSRQR